MSGNAANRWWVLLSVMMAFLPIVLDMTILHVAVPSLTLGLQATGAQVLWIIDIYPLLMASLLIPMGTLADKVGHRRMMVLGLGIFGVGSVLAAFSPTAWALVGARAFMAFGAAMVMPCTLAIIRQTFEDETERATALGVWGAVASAGAAVGPLAGGALLEHFWWGAVFLVNVPVMLVVMPLVIAYSPRHSTLNDARWPIGQAVVLMAGIMASVYALKSGFVAGQSLVVTGAFFIAGVCLLGGFVSKQLHSPAPMLDLSLFRIPAIGAGVGMALVVMGALAGVELMLAQELQFVLGQTPLQAGVFMLPLMIASAVGGPFSGRILRAVGLRVLASASLLVSAGSLVGLAVVGVAGGGVEVVGLLAALGLALSVGMTASSLAIMSNTPVEKAGSAGALEATSYDLGSGLGITVFGIVLASSYQRSIQLPSGLAPELADAAARSIGETMMAANALGGEQGQQLAAAGQAAFSLSHNLVLLSAAGLIAWMSAVVWRVLRHDPAPRNET
ncbi:MFS transporter [Pseudomonas viridiflava]|uniref:MFS transporter n=1 Tax=Pseudomonas viridiflava TaxID=33069 RepID=UPI00280B8010|nr:MFS transporter [Pseudomonas viridiflava]